MTIEYSPFINITTVTGGTGGITETAMNVAISSAIATEIAARNTAINNAVSAEAIVRNTAIANHPDSSFRQLYISGPAPAFTEIPSEVSLLPAEDSETGDSASVQFDDAIRHYEANPWTTVRTFPIPSTGESTPLVEEVYANAGAGNVSKFVKEYINGFWYFAVANEDATAAELEVLLSTVGSENTFNISGINYHDPGIAHHYVSDTTHPSIVRVGKDFYYLSSTSTLAEKQANPINGGNWTKWVPSV